MNLSPADPGGARAGDGVPSRAEESAGRPWGLNQAILLALLAVAVAALFRKFGLEGMLSIALVAVGLGFVIFIHELGHFAVAKWCDVHVETFSIGFGPAIPGCSFRRGETIYKIAWFPLGGYVKMVGEGAETEEEDDDPRSFRNKSVWQRMAIISAGVIMNVILGLICFVFVYRTHGWERPVGEIGQVDSGSPAWKAGLRTAMILDRIATIQDPFFDDLTYEVRLSSTDESLPVLAHMPGQKPGDVLFIKPRCDKGDPYPVIGLGQVMDVKLPPKTLRRSLRLPVTHDSAAARAQPAFDFGDVIVATSDPVDPRQIKPLANPDGTGSDSVELYRRMTLLAGKPMEFEVLRREGKEEPRKMRIEVPASYHWVLPGLKLKMGSVTALRDNSEAAKQLQARDLQKGNDGDILKWLEITDDANRKIRYVTSPILPNEKVAEGVKQVYVDPTRLPFELEKWAQNKNNMDKVVRLKVLRQDPKSHKEAEFPPGRDDAIELPWPKDESWKFDREGSLNPRSPLSIPALGIAYQVDTLVAEVVPGSAADMAGLKALDRIKAVRYQENDSQHEQTVSGKWIELEPDQWAHVAWTLQVQEYKEFTVKVESQGAKESHVVHLFAQEDPSWPVADRGLALIMSKTKIQKADGIGDAMYLGMQRTQRSIVAIYLSLRAIFTGRVSWKSMGGPIMIATLAYDSAGQSIYDLIFFLGMISINLAVINFLPIPVLDGGHMVFLIWEKIRGVPASQTVQVIATYVGLLVILALMVITFWVDITRLFP